MESKLHTFIDIFKDDTSEDNQAIKKIVIPIIQRDYAQGRQESGINRVRSRFLQSLYEAVTKEPITLDFVYGDVDEKGVMTPLDGQQRLTTLFLLHWYAAKKEGISDEEYSFLGEFSYETRYSARDFCTKLVTVYEPDFSMVLSEDIINQAWFPLEWKKDPSINSMLVMIDAITEKFKDVEGLWEKLKGNAITFYFLPIKDMGLTDELYIKMNSRGKPLTVFEHFKAEFEQELKKIDREKAETIIRKIDLDWTDMLWPYRGSNNIIDDEFLRYFQFICDIICYKEGDSPQGKNLDEFELQKKYFSTDSKNVKDNIELFESMFDCWCGLDGGISPADFLNRYMSNTHEPGKILIENRYKLDIFQDCLDNYGILSGRNRIFPLNRIVLIYAFTVYLRNKDTISEEDFIRRLRIVNNLIQNSEDEISDSTARAGGNRMPAILAQVDGIIIRGQITNELSNNFNDEQLREENEKISWVKEHQDKAEILYRLEDHSLLQGQIGIVGLENIDFANRFESLFSCDIDKVDKALMSVGFYGQRERNKWRFQLGSNNTKNRSAWRALFHKSTNTGYENTKKSLCELLAKEGEFTNEKLDAVVDAFLKSCEEKKEYDIRYYYIKYDFFRPGAYGKYYWDDYDNSKYKMFVMRTGQSVSSSTYQPFLYGIDKDNVSGEDYGRRILWNDMELVVGNSGYYIRESENPPEGMEKENIDEIIISQNANGIDTEDRILKMREYAERNGLVSYDEAAAPKEAEEKVLVGRFAVRKKYWEYALEKVHNAHSEKGSFSKVNPSTDSWLSGSFGVGGFWITLIAGFENSKVEINLAKSEKRANKEAYDYLYENKDEIENRVGTPLIWDRLDDYKASKVRIVLDNVSIKNKEDWEKMVDFHAKWSKKFYDVIIPYLVNWDMNK